MSIRTNILSLILFLLVGIVKAQPGEGYIDKLSGKVDQEWIKSVGESIPANQIEYTIPQSPGI